MTNEEQYRLRHQVYGCFRKWDVSYEFTDSVHLKQLLTGDEDNYYTGKHSPMSGEEIRLCKLLIGEHGHTVYKMLLIKHGMKNDGQG